MNKVFHCTVQLVFLMIFIWQMQVAIKEFISMPVVNTSQVKSVNDIKPPIIYICIQDQFDYKKG